MHHAAFDSQIRHFKHLLGYILQSKRNLKDWVVAQAALRPQVLHYLLERDLLVCGCVQCGFSYSREKLTNARIPREVRAQRYCVHKETNERLNLRAGATCNG